MTASKGLEGQRFDLDTGVVRKGRMLVQSVRGAIFFMGFGVHAERLRRAAFESQPRVPAGNPGGGEWTNGQSNDRDGGHTDTISDGGVAGADFVPAVAEDASAKKDRFIDGHLADTRDVAEKLGVPVENILGLAALESGWGNPGATAVQGNNYFGIHYPAPFANGYAITARGAKVSTFASYADNLKSFVAISGNLVRGKVGPEDFARALQDSGKFGIDTDTGEKRPTYIADVAGTIRGIGVRIAYRRS